MHISHRVINYISLLIINLISCLFFVKYATRLFHSYQIALILAILFSIIVILLLFKIDSVNIQKLKIDYKRQFFIIVSIITLAMLILVIATPDTSQVGRLPAINEWLANLLSGKFPYNTPANPSSFPMMFIIALPFYLIGELGFMEVLGFVIFAIIVFYYSITMKDIVMRLFLLLTLPMFYYEILVRSELFFNVVLVILAVLFTKKYLLQNKINLPFILTAILYGLLLSTRLIAGIVIAIFILYFFRSNYRQMIIFSAICILSFIATIVPFIIWDTQYFLHKGPFSVQSLYLPKIVILLAPLVIIFFVKYLRNIRDVFFYIGAVLFVLVAISFSLHCINYGFYESIFERSSYFDIGYFIFPIPFFILSINSKLKVN